MKMKKIGFVGLGAMGSVMAPLLARAGFSLFGFDSAKNLRPIRDVTLAESLNDLVGCDAVITMLPDCTVVRFVVDQLVEEGFKGLFIDMSSSHPDSTLKLGKKLASLGIRLIDAPVSGGVKKASEGTLMVMAGGTNDDITAASPLIKCFGTIQHVGPLGAGHAMKALNNYVSAAGLLAAMQALATANSFGIAPQKFTNVINGSTGRNNTTEVKLMPFIVPRSYNSGFFLRLLAKDVMNASELIKSAGFEIPLTPALNKILDDALLALHSDADHTELYELINPESTG